jgi:hypothetical protein
MSSALSSKMIQALGNNGGHDTIWLVYDCLFERHFNPQFQLGIGPHRRR